MKRSFDWLSLLLGASFMCLAVLFFADQSSRSAFAGSFRSKLKTVSLLSGMPSPSESS